MAADSTSPSMERRLDESYIAGDRRRRPGGRQSPQTERSGADDENMRLPYTLSIRAKLLLGCGALALVTFIVGGIELTIFERADQVRVELTSNSDAEALLLNIDRDSYQAQIALEQLASISAEEDITSLLDDYTSNRDQTLSRWETARSGASRSPSTGGTSWASWPPRSTAWSWC